MAVVPVESTTMRAVDLGRMSGSSAALRAVRKPRLLDLFSGAGGCAVGYTRAGFDVVGVDLAPQPNYPYKFMQTDALCFLDVLLSSGHPIPFDAIHASPPCQHYLNLGGVNRAQGRTYEHPDLIGPVRERLEATGLPWVIENVPDAEPELRDPVRVCGTAFGLPLRRHRLFESNVPIVGTACDHARFTVPRYWTGWRPKGEHRLSTVVQVYGNAGGRSEWPAAMGIDWMTSAEMIEAVPPAYTEWIGRQLLTAVEVAGARRCSSCGRSRTECRTPDKPFLSCCHTCAANDGDTHTEGAIIMPAQPQTFPGKRGETPLSVVGEGGRTLTYRDAHNAVLVGLNRAAGRPDDADPYGHNLDDIDPVAAAQNAAVYLEQLAGIYPNVPDLEPSGA